MGFLGSLKNKLSGGGGVEDGGGQGQDSGFSNRDLKNYEPDPSLLVDRNKNYIPDADQQRFQRSQGVDVNAGPYNPQTAEERRQAAINAGRQDSQRVGPTPGEGTGKVQQGPNSNGRGRF